MKTTDHLLLLSSLVVTHSKLVVDFARQEDLTAEKLRLEGDLIEEYITNSTWRGEVCPKVQERHRVYEYWVSTETNADEASSHLERETAELIKTIIHNINLPFTNTEEPWIEAMIKLRPELNCMDQESETLLKALKEEYLRPPSDQGYNKTMIPTPSHSNISSYFFSQYDQDLFLDQYVFKGRLKDGFFVEAGSTDSVTHSNSLAFELLHGWTGLLVEANPGIFPVGFLSGRKAWQAPVCLATKDHAHFAAFTDQRQIKGGMAGLVPDSSLKDFSHTELQCFPLFSLLLSLGNPTVNLFVLDIEGAEFEVLKALPWDRMDIEVLMVELEHAGKVFPGSRRDVHMFLAEQGFDYAGSQLEDDIFIRKDLNVPERYGIKEDLQKLMEETSNFYFLYNIKQEPIPDEEEWPLRYEQLAKRVPPMEDGDESDVLSDVEEEFDGSSDVEERGSEVDSGRVHDVLVGHSEDNVSEGYQMRRKEL